ncbi:MAG: 3-deoxy-7-phosphoheptulonate synthase [Chloroflexi bacterium]|nr:3-deoxy-7-phosphoheptulonate synthase [Chloroflexota bacterium]
MIVQMTSGATTQQIDHVVERATAMGFDTLLNVGTDKTVVAILGSRTGEVSTDVFAVLAGVDTVTRIMKPYKLASREFHKELSLVPLGGLDVGGERLVMIAGPCAVESETQMLRAAEAVKAAGANALRGGAYKPRTSPFAFQGLAEDGLDILARARAETGLPVVTEVVDPHHVEQIVRYADVLQVGARNMQNYTLLREVGRSGHTVILKRGLSSTINEWLTAADYILAEGNDRVILCERGIRTFETSTRFTLDVSSIAVVKRYSHLPVIVDPSHAAGHFRYVPTLARAAVAAGADGLIVEVHPNPEEALSDGIQSLTFENFDQLMAELRPIARAVGRELSSASEQDKVGVV